MSSMFFAARSSRSAMPTKMPAEPLHPALAARGVTCLEYPRISPCTMHARHQARHRCSHVIMLYARHRPHDDVSVAASIVLQPSDPSHPMQGPIQAIKEYRLLTPRWLCTVVSPSTLTRASQYGDPRVARGEDLGKMRWIHPRERRTKELTHPPASFKKPQLTARWCI
jgi:hypothetical protein